MNIVINAFQAMPDGGQLTVRLTADRDPQGSESVRMAFTDTGSGISEQDLARVFQPYFTTKPLGIGLGLALTRRIVEEHGGEIMITSRVGAGTTVTLALPVGVGDETSVARR